MTTPEEVLTGLGSQPQDKWPEVPKDKSPIEIVGDKDAHDRVLNYCMTRVRASECAMKNFHSRWQVSEKKLQAYISLADWEQRLKDLNKAGEPPKAVNIIIPYSFATISTIVTYLLHTFAGRNPIFQVTGAKSSAVEPAQAMEIAIQYNLDRIRFIKHLHQFLTDGQVYGVSVLRCLWKTERKLRTVWVKEPTSLMAGIQGPSASVRRRETRTTFEGNDICTIDPFMFLPDPSVPMSEVNKRGEFVFWKSFEGKHTLKLQERAKKISYVDRIPDQLAESEYTSDSARAMVSMGEAHPGRNYNDPSMKNFREIIQGSVVLIPKELGLSEEDFPRKYIISIGNRGQIIQCEPLQDDHDMHPVCVSEPYTLGYGFGHPGMSDYIGPIQDVLSWLVNSHMDNVKTAINNMWLVDPSRVEMQDIKKPGAGKIIRLKQTAYGSDVNEAIRQLAVSDVTRGHIADFAVLMKMGDAMSSITDNLRGLQDSGGRKTATEVRTSGESAGSRLIAMAKLISSQALSDLPEMMSSNIQQYLSEEFMVQVVGNKDVRLSPEHLVGDFNFPIHDGTLPLDKIALLDVWKEIFIGVAQDQQLRQDFSVVRIFEYIAQLGGAKNIEEFKNQTPNLQVLPDQQVAELASSGGAVPLPGPSPLINAGRTAQ